MPIILLEMSSRTINVDVTSMKAAEIAWGKENKLSHRQPEYDILKIVYR